MFGVKEFCWDCRSVYRLLQMTEVNWAVTEEIAEGEHSLWIGLCYYWMMNLGDSWGITNANESSEISTLPWSNHLYLVLWFIKRNIYLQLVIQSWTSMFAVDNIDITKSNLSFFMKAALLSHHIRYYVILRANLRLVLQYFLFINIHNLKSKDLLQFIWIKSANSRNSDIPQ